MAESFWVQMWAALAGRWGEDDARARLKEIDTEVQKWRNGRHNLAGSHLALVRIAKIIERAE